MFDQEQPKNSNTPGNLPVEPADMFAGVEHDSTVPKAPDALSTGLLKKKEPEVMQSGEGMIQSAVTIETKGSPFKVVGIVLIMLFVFGGLGGGAWWFYQNSQKNVVVEKPVSENNNLTVETSIEPVKTEVVIPEVVPAPVVVVEDKDSDGDGLSDIKEQQLSTDMNKSDTDGDLLSDGDEVLVWKTDPLNSDTDGDKYSDGAEVNNGYSPTGPGKLFAVPTSTVPTEPATSVDSSTL